MKKLAILIAAIAISAMANAQAVFTTVTAKKQFNKEWSASLSADYRTHDQLKSTARWALGIDLDYKPFKFLRIGTGYELQQRHTMLDYTSKGNIVPAYWNFYNRWHFTVAGQLKVGNVSVGLRERYQLTHRNHCYAPKYGADGYQKADEYISSRDKNILRSRLGIEWDKKKCAWSPFANVEFYDNLCRGFDLEKIRYTIGTGYKIDKHNSVELYYRFIDERQAGDKNLNVIGAGYTFKF